MGSPASIPTAAEDVDFGIGGGHHSLVGGRHTEAGGGGDGDGGGGAVTASSRAPASTRPHPPRPRRRRRRGGGVLIQHALLGGRRVARFANPPHVVAAVEQVLAEAVGVDRRAITRIEQRACPAWAVVCAEGLESIGPFAESASRRRRRPGGGGGGGGERWCGKLSSPLLYGSGSAHACVKPPMYARRARDSSAPTSVMPTQHCGGGGGDGGGGAPVRQPQSMQSVPHAHTEYWAPSPPSSQTELFTRAFTVSLRTPSRVRAGDHRRVRRRRRRRRWRRRRWRRQGGARLQSLHDRRQRVRVGDVERRPRRPEERARRARNDAAPRPRMQGRRRKRRRRSTWRGRRAPCRRSRRAAAAA